MAFRTISLSREEAALLNPLQLAYLGDTVWETMVRSELIEHRMNVHHMHQECVRRVNAGAQARALEVIQSALSGEEQAIVRRGRNAHAHHPVPRRQGPESYASATGFEALIGFLYATGQEERLRQVYEMIRKEYGTIPGQKEEH